MYLIIAEDGTIQKLREITEDELSAADDGLCDLIDLHEENPKRYYDQDWHEIELWEDNIDLL